MWQWQIVQYFVLITAKISEDDRVPYIPNKLKK